MSFLIFINMYLSLHSSALRYNSKISLYSINLGCRVKKITTEMSVQGNESGTGVHKILKKKNKFKLMLSTVITAVISVKSMKTVLCRHHLVHYI